MYMCNGGSHVLIGFSRIKINIREKSTQNNDNLRMRIRILTTLDGFLKAPLTVCNFTHVFFAMLQK
jgi:hypothetical protein